MKKWREFERLVSRIEKLLSPRGAVVKSPDLIGDKVTGQLREVDASVRYTIGSVHILIAIECRDRKAVPDDTWIEQLATKKQKIGASNILAVSSSHFTKPAIESARLYGIDLRVTREITDEDILSWIDRISIVNEVGKVGVGALRVAVYDEDPQVDLAPSVDQALEKHGLNAKVFFSPGDCKNISIADVMDCIVERYNALRHLTDKTDAPEKVVLQPGDAVFLELSPRVMHLFDDVPDNGLASTKTFSVDLREGGLTIQTVKGPRHIQRLELDLVLEKTVEEIPKSRMIEYSTTEADVSSIAEADIELFHRDHREGFVLSYSAPKQENAPVALLVSQAGEADGSRPDSKVRK